MGGDRLVLPLHIFGDDRGVPGAARGRDGAGEIIGQDARQDDAAPPFPAADAKIVGGFAQIIGKRRGAGDHIEHDVPLRARDDEDAEPDVGVELEGEDQRDRRPEQEIDREGGEELRGRLDALGDARAQADPDADGNPDDRGDRHQHEDAQEGVEVEEKHLPDVVERQLGAHESDHLPEAPSGDGDDERDPGGVDQPRRRRLRRRALCGRGLPAQFEKADRAQEVEDGSKAQANPTRAHEHVEHPGAFARLRG